MEKNILKFGSNSLFSDVVVSEDVIVRICSVPEISKYLFKKNLHPDIVVVPSFIIHNELGDSITGEEFIQWNSIFIQKKPIYYVGEILSLKNLYNKLLLTVPGDFNKDKTKLVWRRWLKKYFKLVPLNNSFAKIGNYKF